LRDLTAESLAPTVSELEAELAAARDHVRVCERRLDDLTGYSDEHIAELEIAVDEAYEDANRINARLQAARAGHIA
jgi:hypothetical protein